jgi:hypothetical protein
VPFIPGHMPVLIVRVESVEGVFNSFAVVCLFSEVRVV